MQACWHVLIGRCRREINQPVVSLMQGWLGRCDRHFHGSPFLLWLFQCQSMPWSVWGWNNGAFSSKGAHLQQRSKLKRAGETYKHYLSLAKCSGKSDCIRKGKTRANCSVALAPSTRGAIQSQRRLDLFLPHRKWIDASLLRFCKSSEAFHASVQSQRWSGTACRTKR